MQMNDSQLVKAFSELNLLYSPFQSFYELFRNGLTFDMKKLCSLGIVLGNAKDNEKLKTLFQNYDLDLSGLLSRQELMVMIADITEIFCLFIPQAVFSKNQENLELAENVTILKRIRKTVVSLVVNSMLEGKNEMGFSQFCSAFRRVEGFECILNAGKMRKYCFYHWQVTLKPVNNAIYTIENVKGLDKIIFSEGRRSKKRRQRRFSTQI
jgi:Ca2+-binding EF-hand superfamily protein